MFVRPHDRYRLYIDETGTQTLKKAHEDRFLCLMGIIMRQDVHDGQFTASMTAIKFTFFENAGLIFHRHDMVRGDPPFEMLKSDEEFKLQFEGAWLDLVSNSSYIAMAGAIDKVAHKEKYRAWQHDPYHYCLEILVERFVRWLSRNRFVGDVLIESRDKWADKRLKRAYSHFWHNGNDHIRPKEAQAVLLSRELKFADKRDNVAAHQLADSLAHPVLRHLKTEKLGLPPATGYGTRLVNVLVERKLARRPKDGLIAGWGLKWLPE
jgi:hypothetical protein